jgi:hypothetical protein
MANVKKATITRPITCASCGGTAKAVVQVAIGVPNEWTTDELSVEVTGRHKDCQKVLVAGAVEGVLGKPDVSGITEGGSIHKHWDKPPGFGKTEQASNSVTQDMMDEYRADVAHEAREFEKQTQEEIEDKEHEDALRKKAEDAGCEETEE